MNVQKVEISKIKPAKWNPEIRTKRIGKLADSIEEYGQLVPIILVKNGRGYDLVDGHRRVAALDELGETVVDAVISNKDQLQAYTEINSTTRPLRGRELTDAALAGAELRGQSGRYWAEMTEAMTKGKIRQLHKQRPFSPFWWEIAKKTAKYTSLEPVAVFEWLVTSGTSLNHVLVAVSGAMTAPALTRTIKNGRRLVMKPAAQ